jgi:hypothetical protein
MPALFAYLIAVGLFLGGGYGALSWLAAPEPVKVVAKANPKPPSPRHVEATAEPASSPASLPEAVRSEAIRSESVRAEENAPPIDDSAHIAAASSNQAPSRPPEARAVANEQDGTAEDLAPAQDQQIRPAHAETSPATAAKEAGPNVEAPRDVKQRQADRLSTPASRQVSPTKIHVATLAAPAVVARTAKRPHLQQASRSDKRPLTLMTLRTIEFPDGRRMTRLIPYRGGERTVAFDVDDAR